MVTTVSYDYNKQADLWLRNRNEGKDFCSRAFKGLVWSL